MTGNETLDYMRLDSIEVTLIKPLRKGDCYEKGTIIGFKAGLIGGGHKFKKGGWYSYDSTKRKVLKKPMVRIAYNAFTYGGSQHCDWVHVDNCEFNLVEKESDK